jgi:predicted alpha/beta hydrolase
MSKSGDSAVGQVPVQAGTVFKEFRLHSGSHQLAATLFSPANRGDVRGCVVLNSGMAIPRRFYARFAEWLASRGYACLTYDYSGMLDSRSAIDAEKEITLFTWGKDFDAAALHLQGLFPGVKFFAIAHSFGGSVLSIAAETASVAGLVLIGSGSGYWGHVPWGPRKLGRIAFWYFLLPSLARMFGYFPGQMLRLLGDIPKGVSLQWASWCRNPEYMVGAVSRCYGLTGFNAPGVSLTFNDDHVFPESSVRWYAAQFGAPLAVRQVFTRGRERIGHLNFFRIPVGLPFWEEVRSWLDVMAEGQIPIIQNP